MLTLTQTQEDKLINTISLKELEEYAYEVGQSAKLLEELGASPSQAQNYINYDNAAQVYNLDIVRETFYRFSKKGYTDRLNSKYQQPLYDLYKKLLRTLIQSNAICLRGERQ